MSGDSSVDTKLPYKQRMHKVEINKKEGNELVKDQNWSQGIARYRLQSISLCAFATHLTVIRHRYFFVGADWQVQQRLAALLEVL